MGATEWEVWNGKGKIDGGFVGVWAAEQPNSRNEQEAYLGTIGELNAHQKNV